MIIRSLIFGAVVSLWGGGWLGANTIRVATYNLENYLIMDRRIDEQWRPEYPKPEDQKRALRSVIAEVNPDILALQEMGPAPFLAELKRDLKKKGFDFPHAYVFEGEDNVRHLAVLSRIPFAEVRGHRGLDFPYFGERENIRRGLLEVVFAGEEGDWSLFVVHLKSKWTERDDDPAAALKRTGEATAARNFILEHHDPAAGARYIIAGDFNDTRDTAPLRRFLQRGPVVISEAIPALDSRGHSWTHHWERQDIYSRVDFLLVSPALMGKLVDGRGHVYDGPGYDRGSDHRLVWADFTLGETKPEP